MPLCWGCSGSIADDGGGSNGPDPIDLVDAGAEEAVADAGSDIVDGGVDGGVVVARPPNILLLIADDLGLDASRQFALSDDLPTTPHLDALSAGGLTFENVWATPSCTTTRGTIISGLFGIHSGINFTPAVMPASTSILQALLARDPLSAQYRSAVIGKWHLGGPNPQAAHPNSFGLEHYAGNLAGVLPSYTNWTLTTDGVNSAETRYHTTLVTDLARDWIAAQGAEPWFAWVAYAAPHSPFHLPPAALHSQTLSGTAADIAARPRAYYLAMIESLDTEIGRLLASMDPDVRDNTVIIFVGDNGTPGPVVDTRVFARGHAKESLYEGGLRVPMIVAGAGVTRHGEREPALVNTADLFSTIAEVAGTSAVDTDDAQSFASLFTNSAAPRRSLNYAEYITGGQEGWAVRGPQYKLIVPHSGAEELYDVVADIAEVNNLIGDAQLADVATTLRTFGLAVRGDGPVGSTDITNAIFTTRSATCGDYVASFSSAATDIRRNLPFTGAMSITVDADRCVFRSNAIPNHDFNDGAASFPNPASAQVQVFETPRNPTRAAAPTLLSLTVDNAILLNGVKVDILAAGCFGVGNGRVGCNNVNQPWRFDPMSAASGFNVDTHHAHTQPDGAYHYHGPPNALFDQLGDQASGLIGFAADGFPIFGSFFDDGSQIRAARSSYRVRSGSRPTGAGNPGGVYDGTYRDDYEFVPGIGDLDECNGMTTADGVYGYYITDAFPWVIGCFTGTPDPSFRK